MDVDVLSSGILKGTRTQDIHTTMAGNISSVIFSLKSPNGGYIPVKRGVPFSVFPFCYGLLVKTLDFGGYVARDQGANAKFVCCCCSQTNLSPQSMH